MGRIQLLLSVLLRTAIMSGTHAAILYHDGTVIAFNSSTESLQVLPHASLLIENDRITRLSEDSLVQSDLPANTTIFDATDKIIGPCNIDTHHHMRQTQFKRIGSNASLDQYYQRYGEYGPAEQNFTPDDVYVGQLIGYLETLYPGTTSVLDFSHASSSDATVDACVNATFDSGSRSLHTHAAHIIPNGYSREAQIDKLQSLADDPRFLQSDPASLVNLSLAYDRFCDAAAANISLLRNISKQSNLSVVSTHHLGGPLGYGNSPTVLQSYGLLNGTVPVVFANFSWLDMEDGKLLRSTNQYISQTPESEFHFGHNQPYAHLIQDQALVGADCHFTFSSSMVSQARLWLQSLRWPNYLAEMEDWAVPVNKPM